MKTIIKKKPLSPDIANKWARYAHLFFLDALMTESSWHCDQLVFHGGTSLYLSWQSARFSEDLDFLLSNKAERIDAVLKKAFQRVSEQFSLIDPEIKLTLKSKTKDAARMEVVQIDIEHPDYLGKALIKAEFWKVPEEYLDKYPSTLRTPQPESDIHARVNSMIPVATLKAAYCDKLTAFATRPYLKWRDIYDLWWIGTQHSNEIQSITEIAEQFLHNVSAYDTRHGLLPADALRQFTERDKQEIFNCAEKELGRWLAPALFSRLYPQEVKNMIDYVYQALNAVTDEIDGGQNNDDTPHP